MASKRGYLSQAELTEYANITITDATEADDQISQCEELIDSYVGYQEKFMEYSIQELAAGGGASSLTLNSNQQNIYEKDYFKLCQVEIIGGTGAGQRRMVTTSTKAGVLSVDTAWTTPPDSTSFYKITQLGKFPRLNDVFSSSNSSPITYFKSIPEAVKRAVAAQVEYVINMGSAFFSTDKSLKQSESIGDYSYQLAQGSAGVDKLIAPKAKLLLRGIKNRLGKLIA